MPRLAKAVNDVDTYEASIVIAKPRRRWLKPIGCGLGILLVPALVLLIPTVRTWMGRHREVQQRLAEVIADLGSNDPGWRLEDIEAARAQIPEEENSARIVAKAGSLLPKHWKPQVIEDLCKNLAPEELLAPDLSNLLAGVLDTVRPALVEARKLAGLPRGRHRIKYARNIFGTLLKDQSQVLPLTQLLLGDSLRHEQKGDLASAMISCRAAFNAGRSLGDEPFAVSQMIRIRSTFLACQGVERVLAQGQLPLEEMAAFQQLLADEDSFPDLLICARGERAGDHGTFEAIESGDVSISNLSDRRLDWHERLFGFLYRDNICDEHPLMLALMSRWVAVAKLSLPEQSAAERLLEQRGNSLPEEAILTRLLLPAFSRIGNASRRNHAYLRCLNVALAAERYRREKHKWPDNLDQLCANYMPEIPLDPFDGLLLRYLRWRDGVLVYCVGQDARDNGGNLDPENQDQPGADIGICLWDMTKRRQAPRSKRREEEQPR